MAVKKINNIKDLTAELVSSYELLSQGKITEKKARELSSLSSKIISSVKTNMDYNKSMKYKKKIAFLEVR